jgi:hypothetical protein
MNPLSIVNALLLLLGNAPALVADVQNLAGANWNHDMIVNARQGVGLLGQMFADLERTIAPPPPPAPPAPAPQVLG